MIFKENVSSRLLHWHAHTSIFRFQTDKNVKCDKLNVAQDSTLKSYKTTLGQSNLQSNYFQHIGFCVPKCPEFVMHMVKMLSWTIKFKLSLKLSKICDTMLGCAIEITHLTLSLQKFLNVLSLSLF